MFEGAWSTTNISSAQIFSVGTLREAEIMQMDNQHPILAIDSVNDRIVYRFDQQDEADIVVPFTQDGAAELYVLIEKTHPAGVPARFPKDGTLGVKGKNL